MAPLGNGTPSEKELLRLQEAQDFREFNGNSSTRRDSLQNTDIITPDADEHDLPPPAYGDIYGEIHSENHGMGTTAYVTDDGRVNIRVNQLNRRLSQLFAPALRQQLQSAQQDDTQPPPPPYVPPSLGGAGGLPPPPSLNVAIHVVGSHGDVQPFVALGKVLKDVYGHRVRLATHPKFKNFVQENGLEFFSIGGDPSQLMAFMVKNPSLLPGFRSLFSGDVGKRRRDVAEYIQGCWRSCYQTGDGMNDGTSVESSAIDPASESGSRPFVADCIIANPPSFAHIHCAEKLGIPLHIMFTMPYSPTQAFPHPLANIQASNADPQLTNFISYAMIELLSWQGLGDIINRFRKKCLGLEPISVLWAPGMLQRLKVPHTYCWSPALIPKPRDWGPHISISGFYFLKSSNYTPSIELREFLDAGPAPVYIGFGSIVLDDPEAMTKLIFETARKTGQRILLSRGWGGMGGGDAPEGVFMLGQVPHDWLFQHVSCVVHHGGAGTTSTGIAAGRPTVVVPFFGDQPFWGSMVARAGAGPDPIPFKRLTADKLADAINFCLEPESLQRAQELASKIAAEERGSEVGAQSFHQHLELDRLRCSLAPSRPASWRIKRTKVKLSAFAAYTLANANLLDLDREVKLFRAQEYQTDEGPWDPVSGGFTAACRAFNNMGKGIAELPTETFKAVYNPTRSSSRQQSQASLPKAARPSETTRRGQSETSLDEQKHGADLRSPSSLSVVSASTSLRSKPHDRSDDASIRRVLRRAEPSFSKEPDLLRQNMAHTSKGAGRFARALVQSPMDMSVSFTRGFHNLPKMWGDDTIRPQEQVRDLKSGMQALGKEFGYGWYDGITGLATQPWKGAQKDGAAGFFKGVGKGVGGFVAKPSAAMMGVLGHSMKGIHKEVQKSYAINIEDYIAASRAAQGYEEWLQSSEEERQDVIDRWKLIQKYLKKRHNEEMMQDMLDAQAGRSRSSYGRTMTSPSSVSDITISNEDVESMVVVTDSSNTTLQHANTISANPRTAAGISSVTRRPVPNASTEKHADVERNIHVQRSTQDIRSQLRQERADNSSRRVHRSNLRQAVAASKAEAQQHEREELEYQEQLKLAMMQSLDDESSDDNLDDYDSDLTLDEEDVEPANDTSEKTRGVSSSSARPPSYDPGHLAGTTRNEFQARQQQHGQYSEKTAQEKSEEEIVLEYIKKQSLLETDHRKSQKGKSRASPTEDDDDEDLKRALELSLQDHERRHGESSKR